MYRITKRFDFSASHQLRGLPEDHQCARLHGHNYSVILELRDPGVDNVGFVVDYGELKPFKEYIDSHLDHRNLNDIFEFNPTAENLARALFIKAYEFWPMKLSAVRVKETEKTEAEYRP